MFIDAHCCLIAALQWFIIYNVYCVFVHLLFPRLVSDQAEVANRRGRESKAVNLVSLVGSASPHRRSRIHGVFLSGDILNHRQQI